MHYTKTLLLVLPAAKRMMPVVLFFLPLFGFSQKRDTVPVRKPVTVTNRVVTNSKDTTKPVIKNVITNPDVINRIITPSKDTGKPVIKDVNVRPDVIDGQIGIRIKYPDTLDIGEYLIVVEAYDKGGEWVNAEKAYKHLNGIGRVKFKCPATYTVWPGLWKNATIFPVKYTVVGNLPSKANEISIRDADALGLKAKPGEEVELDMPHFNGKVYDISKYINDIKAVKTPEGIRVRFTDITATVSKVNASLGNVITGIAKYPTDPAIPAVPFTLNISPGFTLEVSAVSFSPGQNALVTANLLLPVSITQNNDCGRGRLDLGSFRLSPTCEFYKELPSQNYGVFGVGNTTLAIGGKGYVADFSSSQTYPASGKPANWKGVVLMQGESKGSPYGSVISNIGYMQADYTFTNGIVESSGLTATFRSAAPYGYGAAQPYGYQIDFSNATVNVAASQVAGGTIYPGKVMLPKTAVRQVDDHEVILTDANLTIKPTMDLVGYSLIQPDATVYWGDLIAAGGGNRKSFGVQNMTRQVWLYFSAQLVPAFNPTNATGKKFTGPPGLINAAVVEAFKMQGATFTSIGLLVVNTPNIPASWSPDNPANPPMSSPVWFRLSHQDTNWLNVVTEGVHCNIKGDIMESPGLKLGDPSKPLYVGVTPFQTLTMLDGRKNNKPFSSIKLQCVESSVLNCDFSSHLQMPEPVGDTLSFREMVFTSTANNAGGKLALKPGDSLSYWGLQLVPKPGFSDAGLVSVKTGQIILSAAGLAETRHFAQPFWLTWGEMLANGSMGRLFFDYNSAGQQFDKFNYIHNAVALSPINPDPAKKGYLRVGGTAFFPFFGGDYLHIVDTYTPDKMGNPFNGRTVTLSSSPFGSGFMATNFAIGGNWSDGLGIFNFTLQYAALAQDGFVGNGTSLLRNLIGGNLGSTLAMNSRGTCIRIGTNLMDQRSISFGSVANISNITRIWGCVCIINDGIENLVVGGEVTNAANVSVAARVGSYLQAILQITPSLARVTIDGEAYMSLALSLDALVNGHMQLTMNWAGGYMEGEVSGKFRVADGSPVLSGSSLQAEGQLNWHLGVDFNELQGMVSLKMMSSTGILGVGSGTGIGAAFYIGMNAPKDRAWVLRSPHDPRYALNMTPMPSRLSGIYGSLYVSQGISLFIISGGYEINVGFGAFTLAPPEAAALGAVFAGAGIPYVVGNLGGRIHGEILGGLVSAAAWFNLQVLGPAPFGFQGTVGLEACVLWVACGSVDVTIGLNSSEGFYIR